MPAARRGKGHIVSMSDNSWNLFVGLGVASFVILLITFGTALLGSSAGEVATGVEGILGGWRVRLVLSSVF